MAFEVGGQIVALRSRRSSAAAPDETIAERLELVTVVKKTATQHQVEGHTGRFRNDDGQRYGYRHQGPYYVTYPQYDSVEAVLEMLALENAQAEFGQTNQDYFYGLSNDDRADAALRAYWIDQIDLLWSQIPSEELARYDREVEALRHRHLVKSYRNWCRRNLGREDLERLTKKLKAARDRVRAEFSPELLKREAEATIVVAEE